MELVLEVMIEANRKTNQVVLWSNFPAWLLIDNILFCEINSCGGDRGLRKIKCGENTTKDSVAKIWHLTKGRARK